jgi:hypothetical protein
MNSMILGGRKISIKRDSRTFMCDAGHTSFVFPTTNKNTRFHYLRREEITVLDKSNEEENLSPPTVVTRTPSTLVSTRTVLSVASSLMTRWFVKSPPKPNINNLVRNDLCILQTKNLEVANSELCSLQKKHDDMQIHLQTHLLSSRNPEDLPFNDSTSFDGTDVVNDTDKRRKIKVEKFVATLINTKFCYDGLVCLEIFTGK